MKVSHWFAALAITGASLASVASAQQIGMPTRVMPAGYSPEYYVQDDAASPSDTIPAAPMTDDMPMEAAPAQGAQNWANAGCSTCDTGCNMCDTGCSSCGCGGGLGSCCLGDPIKLWEDPCDRGYYLGGWAQVGYHTQGNSRNVGPNPQGLGDGLFNNYPNQVQAHQLWVYAGKEASADCGCWDWGFHVDYVYGTDGPNTQAFGDRPRAWDNLWDNGIGNGGYGSALPQLYGEVAYGDNLSVKAGKFFTIIGYEVVQAPSNFFYSRAWTMNNLEPFTHTGAIASYKVSDKLTVQGGWSAGWDTGFNHNGGDVGIWGVSYDVNDCINVTYAATHGNFGFGPGGSDQNGYNHSVVAQADIGCGWSYVFHHDYVDNNAFLTNLVGAPTNTAASFNNFLFYEINDCWKAGVRQEFVRGGAFELSSYTAGVNYKPHANVVIRPEVRWFDYKAGPNVGGLNDSTIFGVDAIVTF